MSTYTICSPICLLALATLISTGPAIGQTPLEASDEGYTMGHASGLSIETGPYYLTEQQSQHWDPDAHEWTNDHRIHYTRDVTGFETERVSSEWDSALSRWVPEARSVFDLDNQNRVLETLEYSWDPLADDSQGDWTLLNRKATTFDSEGNELINEEWSWNESANDYILRNRSLQTFDGSLLVQQVTESTRSGEGELVPEHRTSFEYDQSANVTQRREETYDEAAGEWKNVTRRLWTYDSNGVEIEEHVQTWDDVVGDWVSDFRGVSTFDPDSSNPTEHVRTTQDWDSGLATWVNRYRSVETTPSPTDRVWTYQDWDPLANGGQGDWINDWQHIVTVDSNGDVVLRNNLTWDPAAAGGQGGWVYTGRGVITRNEQGLVVEERGQGWRGSQFYNQFRILYMYEDFTGTAVDVPPAPTLTLEANYPNPFRDKTAIQFDVPHPQLVSLEVFDMLGRKVATLMEGPVPPGSHVATLGAERLAGGLYVYRLRANGVQISRTMMLAR